MTPARTLTPTDRARLSAQCQRILDRLRQGPATNAELATVSLKYTGRISDLRAAGYDIECTRGDGGVNTYRLLPREPVQLPLVGAA